jgi:RNA 2',3'-cyclic 3'-phosphodiesterase
VRLFISIGLEGLKDYLLELQSTLPKGAKMSMTKSFHLTLKFLGRVEDKYLDRIKSSLKTVKFRKFRLSLDSIGVFPKESHIEIIWVGLKPEEKINLFQKLIDDSIKFLFYRNNHFKAHITLARVSYVSDKASFINDLKSIEVKDIKINVKNFKLMKSTLTKDGPVYEA